MLKIYKDREKERNEWSYISRILKIWRKKYEFFNYAAGLFTLKRKKKVMPSSWRESVTY